MGNASRRRRAASAIASLGARAVWLAGILTGVATANPYPRWDQLASVPAGPKARKVKDGGSLAASGDTIYALKGGNTCEFYGYDIVTNVWTTLDSVPRVTPSGSKKRVGPGGRLCAIDGTVYALKGNRTREFYCYDPRSPAGRRWRLLAQTPEAGRRHGIADGAGLASTELGDTAFIYLLRGSNTPEFYRYRIAVDSWERLPDAPHGAKLAGFPKGSCITAWYGRILVLRGRSNEFYAFDLATQGWLGSPPIPSPADKSTKVGAGAGLATNQYAVCALKGNGTVECWQLGGSSWYQDADMGQPVKAGGAICGFDMWFCALAGNKTLDFYCKDYRLAGTNSVPGRSAPGSPGESRSWNELRLRPSSGGCDAWAEFNLPRAGDVSLSVHDVTGRLRLRLRRGNAPAGPQTLDLNARQYGLSPGIYLVSVSARGFHAASKLILE